MVLIFNLSISSFSFCCSLRASWRCLSASASNSFIFLAFASASLSNSFCNLSELCFILVNSSAIQPTTTLSIQTPFGCVSFLLMSIILFVHVISVSRILSCVPFPCSNYSFRREIHRLNCSMRFLVSNGR